MASTSALVLRWREGCRHQHVAPCGPTAENGPTHSSSPDIHSAVQQEEKRAIQPLVFFVV
jgi:hypothetical protein